MNFSDIPQFPHSCWRVNVEFKSVDSMLKRWNEPERGTPLILNPEWQRGHVWKESQQIAFVEYMLKGGTTGREIYFNCSEWMGRYDAPIYCVDGLQRLTAVTRFTNNEIPAFGTLYKDFEGWCRAELNFNMLKIRNKKDLLRVYLDFNSGGTPHNPKELKRIQEMIDNTPEGDTL